MLGDVGGQVAFSREGKVLRAVVKLGQLTRVLEDSAESCDGLAEASELSLRMLASRASEEAASTQPSDASDWGRAAVAPDERFQPAPPHIAESSMPARTSAPIAFPKLTLALSAGAVLAFASKPAFTAEFVFRYRPWRYVSFESLVTVIAFSSPLSALAAPGTYLLVMAAASAGVCMHPLRLTRFVEPFLCAAGSVGALVGRTDGLPESRQAVLPWGAFSPSLVIQGDIGGGLSWQTRAMLQIPFSSRTFSVDGVGPVFQSTPASILIVSGVAMSFL